MKTLQIANKTGNFDFTQDGINQYSFLFKNKEEVSDFYESVRNQDNVVQTNFGGNEFNNNSFIELNEDGKHILVNPPRAKNGDTNWYSYKNDFGFYCTALI